MNILLFIIVLGILIFVHELGHFLFAKLFKIRVDEFGFGYPPRAFKMFRWRGTLFSMNWIPFGGFVKIFGESGSDTELTDEEKKVNLMYKPRWQQALVMFGGILFNVIFAWLLFVCIFTSGVRAPISQAPQSYVFDSADITVTNVLVDSPADRFGLKQGDIIKEYYNDEQSIIPDISTEAQGEIAAFVNTSGESGKQVGFVVLRDGTLKNVVVTPEQGILEGSYAIGIALETIGDLKLPIHQAIVYAGKSTVSMTYAIVHGFGQLFSGQLSLNDVSGPVGIVGQVGQASKIGFAYLITFTALLSLNLAVLNLIPFPALDGGRLFILLIESIIRKQLPLKAVGWVNAIGFFILIGFMLLVTAKDIINLF